MQGCTRMRRLIHLEGIHEISLWFRPQADTTGTSPQGSLHAGWRASGDDTKPIGGDDAIAMPGRLFLRCPLLQC